MNTCIFKIVLFCVVAIAVRKGKADNVQILKLNIKNNPNEYFGEITGDVKPVGNSSALTVFVPIKKDIDNVLRITANVTFNNVNVITNYVFPLCSLYSNVGFRPILRMVEPQEEFPRRCPIPAGEWRLNEYIINPKDFFIFNFISSGHFGMQLNIGPSSGPTKDEPFIQVAIKGIVERDEITEIRE